MAKFACLFSDTGEHERGIELHRAGRV